MAIKDIDEGDSNYLHCLFASLCCIPHGLQLDNLGPLLFQHPLLLIDPRNVVLCGLQLILQKLLLLQGG